MAHGWLDVRNVPRDLHSISFDDVKRWEEALRSKVASLQWLVESSKKSVQHFENVQRQLVEDPSTPVPGVISLDKWREELAEEQVLLAESVDELAKFEDDLNRMQRELHRRRALQNLEGRGVCLALDVCSVPVWCTRSSQPPPLPCGPVMSHCALCVAGSLFHAVRPGAAQKTKG